MADEPRTWQLLSKTEPPQDVQAMLLGPEEVFCAYKTSQDAVVLTDKRLVLGGRPEPTGRIHEVVSLPLKSIQAWSTVTEPGKFNLATLLTLWTSAGIFKLQLASEIDSRELELAIANGAL